MSSIAVVSDSHLSAANPDGDRQWDAVVAHLAATKPDLVIHAGDISTRGDDGEADLDHARRQLDRLPVPWVAVPGNHDVGLPQEDWAVTEKRRTRFEEVMGPRFWVTDLDRFRIVGLDTEALSSGHPDDEASWAWTAEHLAGDRPTMVVVHRPVAPMAEHDEDAARRYLTVEPRRRLLPLLADGPVTAVVSGHLHQWRSCAVGRSRWIWAPSTWAVIDAEFQPVIGQKRNGIVELELDAPEQARLVEPAGIEQLVSSHSRRTAGAAAIPAAGPSTLDSGR